MTASGRFLPVRLMSFSTFEWPLLEKADVQIPTFKNSLLYGRFTLESGPWSARLLRVR
jgi:hypothetical protein